MAGPILRDMAMHLVSRQCMIEYVDNFNLTNVECFKAVLSKLLSLVIIGGSLVVKVPQIVKILNQKSVKGLNVVSISLELFAITAMASYCYVSKFPFSSWGDTLFLGLQTVTICYLVLFYASGFTKASSYISAYLSVVAAIVTGLVPVHILWFAQAMNIPVILISRIIQAHTNYSNGSTGQLSAVTVFMQFFGALARIFTSIQDTGDQVMIATFACSTLTNGIICSQLLYYWNSSSAAAKPKKKNQKTLPDQKKKKLRE